MELGLHGRSALVFGASHGIGAEIARTLAAEGARLSLAGRTRETLDAVAAQLPAGAQAQSVVADLTVTGAAERAVAAAVAKHGALDILVVSIGAARGGDFWDIPDAVWADAFETKFMGLVRALRAALVPMRAAGSGRIVAIVGNTGRQPNPVLLPGSSANAACLAVIKGLADAVAAHGITINALNPGPTRTRRWDRLIAELAANSGRDPADVEAEMLARQPMGRIGDAAGMARLAVILVSDLAEMITGTSLTADGGATRASA